VGGAGHAGVANVEGQGCSPTAGQPSCSVVGVRAQVEWEDDPGRAILVHIPEDELHFFDSLRAEEAEDNEEEEQDGELQYEDDSDEEVELVPLNEGGGWGGQRGPAAQRQQQQQQQQQLKERQPLGDAVQLPYASEAFELA
jgi:hypothetical protein